MLTDEATINLMAGKGGNGAVSFRREKFVPKGGPDGGDGGKGGNINFICSNHVHTLSDYARKKDWQAPDGANGMAKRKTGKSAEDLILPVPPGTVIKLKVQSSNAKAMEEKNIDMTEIGQEILIARGGKGGLGNVHFATATRQVPYFAQKGEKGESLTVKLELKLIADVGLVGLPNAGKSTLLSRISNARPKVAAYPFTTLEPSLGVAKYHDKEFVFADIPGLIEGASVGKGLGIKFLKHLERTKILVHLIDIMSADIEKDYQTVRAELKAWSDRFIDEKEIVVLTKADVTSFNKAEKIAKKLTEKIKKPVIVISASSGQGIEDLLQAVSKAL